MKRYHMDSLTDRQLSDFAGNSLFGCTWKMKSSRQSSFKLVLIEIGFSSRPRFSAPICLSGLLTAVAVLEPLDYNSVSAQQWLSLTKVQKSIFSLHCGLKSEIHLRCWVNSRWGWKKVDASMVTKSHTNTHIINACIKLWDRSGILPDVLNSCSSLRLWCFEFLLFTKTLKFWSELNWTKANPTFLLL